MGSRLGRFDIPSAEGVLRTWHANGKRDDDSSATLDVEERVSVLVWNIKKEQEASFASSFEKMRRSRQLVLLQELHLHNQWNEDFFAGADHHYAMATAFVYHADSSPAGVAIGSSVPSKQSLQALVTADVEPIVGTPKSSLIAQYPISTGGFLLVASVHGINRAAEAAFKRQIDQLFTSLEQELRSGGGPFCLLAGDFNTQSAAKLAYLEAASEKLGLLPVALRPDERTLSRLSQRPLDHAFVSSQIRVEAASCRDYGGSDHAAMTFDLLFPHEGC